MTKLKFKYEEATETFTFTQDIHDEAHRLGLTRDQMLALAIMRSTPRGRNAPVVVRGKLGSSKLTDKGVIEIGGRDRW